jgi:hypothetical protein
MEKVKKKKCRHCKRLFIPDHRNRDRQKYCKNAECRNVSKAASQKKWQNKPANKNYFRGPVNVQRVQQWRKQNPGYRKPKSSTSALQEPLTPQHPENIDDKHHIADVALQDLLIAQSPVIIGLISNFIGSALQDDIAETLFRMQQSGQDILYCQPKERGGENDCKITRFTESST